MSLEAATDGIYQVGGQVGGQDGSSLTLVESDRGVVVVDPPDRAETAAALEIYRKQRGDRQVTAVIYTHCRAGAFHDFDLPVIAPAGFTEENVCAGTILEITRTGQEETVDGVRVIFQLTPGAETPPEMNFLLPARRALSLRCGAPVPDARAWSRCLTEAIMMFGERADVLFTSHHRPIFGRFNIMRYLCEQRDLHAYLHDQTLRLIMLGFTGTEIAEMIQLPPGLAKAWHGSLPPNVLATYQRYLGRIEANPAGLWPHPSVETAERYVANLGGVAGTVAKAGEHVAAGDLRFAANLLQHAVSADPQDDPAKESLAEVYERLGHAARDDSWRDFYLTGAQELRSRPDTTPADLGTAMATALSIEQIFDTLAIRLDAPSAWQETITIDWHFTELDSSYRTAMRNGALVHHYHSDRPSTSDSSPPDLTVRLTKPELLGLFAGQGIDASIVQTGDSQALKRFLCHLALP